MKRRGTDWIGGRVLASLVVDDPELLVLGFE
jgi:hypothetical protein